MAVKDSAQGLRFAARLLPGIVGFSAITGQIVLLRELIVLSNGNELSLGVTLAAWLGWNAVGSSLAGRIFARRADVRTAVAVASAVCGLSLPASLWVMRDARILCTPIPTELLSPVALLLICVTCLSAFCALSGCLFTLAVRMYGQCFGVPEQRAIGYAYLLETAGTGLGGILASTVFLRFLGPFQIAAIVCLLDLLVAALVLSQLRSIWRAVIGAAVLAGSFPLVIRVAPVVEQVSQQRLWTPFHVVQSKESIYGRITVTEAGAMRSIYEDGSILANVPDKAAAEEAVHYALLEHPSPNRVLLIGSSVNGSIAEALQHPSLEQLDVLELDPALTSMFGKLFPSEFATTFSDRRVHQHFGDGRHYLKATHAQFDVIIVSVPDPETAQWNRFYTAEFFRMARSRLAPGGIVALQLRSSEEFISADRAEFLRCIRATLEQEFPYVAFIPGDPIHMFGALQSNLLTNDPQVLISRLHGRNLQTLYVSEYLIPFRMSAERMAQTDRILRPLATTPINHDFRPVAYYFDESLWSAQFRSSYGMLLRKAAQVPYGFVASAAAVVFLVLIAGFKRRGSLQERACVLSGWSVLATGFCLMTLQILLLFTFQSVYGYLYYEMSLLIGMFMTGIALGSWLGIRRVRRPGHSLMRLLAGNQLLLAVSAPLLMVLATLLARAPEALWGHSLAALGFSIMAFLFGIPGGLQFPIAAEIYGPRDPLPGAALLYALDLLGGCAGALVVAGFLVPVYGFWNTAWLAAIVSVAPAVLSLLPGPNLEAISQPSSDVRQTLRQ